jgi:hypothetical protein
LGAASSGSTTEIMRRRRLHATSAWLRPERLGAFLLSDSPSKWWISRWSRTSIHNSSAAGEQRPAAEPEARHIPRPARQDEACRADRSLWRTCRNQAGNRILAGAAASTQTNSLTRFAGGSRAATAPKAAFSLSDIGSAIPALALEETAARRCPDAVTSCGRQNLAATPSRC